VTELRNRRPLVHNITNYVAMTVSANVLLALGASPAMVHAVEEVEDFVAISSSLVINIGTLSPRWVEAMRLAAAKAVALGKPWVLDPVGCGATPYRTGVAAELAAMRPTIIRGNASEIMSLAGAAAAGGKGVDSTMSSDAALAAAAALAGKTGAVVAITGETDYATDGTAMIAVAGGDPLMPLSTALGCALSATTAAFAALRPPLEAAVVGLAVYGAAGAEAASRCRGPGHLPAELCDALHRLDAEMLAKRASIRTTEFA
jgi:hydroxyethylthiazole kinase